MGETVNQFMVAFRIVIRTVCQFLIHSGQTILHLEYVFESHFRFRHHGTRITEYHHLRQIADGNTALYGDSSFCGPLQSRKDFQHGRFSGSVLSYQSNTVFFIDHERHILKQRCHAKFDFQSFY